MSEDQQASIDTEANMLLTPDKLPDKSRSLRARSIQKRLETEMKKHEPKQRPPKQKNSTMSKYRRKTANAKERDRMRCVNDAFERLKNVLPSTEDEVQEEINKGTKVCTLRYAIQYINSLQKLIEDSNNGLIESEFYDMKFPEKGGGNKKSKKKSQKNKKKNSTKSSGKKNKNKKGLGVKKSSSPMTPHRAGTAKFKLKRLTNAANSMAKTKSSAKGKLTLTAAAAASTATIDVTPRKTVSQIIYCNMLLQPISSNASRAQHPNIVLVQQHPSPSSPTTSPSIVLRSTAEPPPLVQLPPVPSPTFSVDSDSNLSNVSSVSPGSERGASSSSNSIALKLSRLEPINWVVAAPVTSPTSTAIEIMPALTSSGAQFQPHQQLHPQLQHQDPAWCGMLDDIEAVLKQDETFDILI